MKKETVVLESANRDVALSEMSNALRVMDRAVSSLIYVPVKIMCGDEARAVTTIKLVYTREGRGFAEPEVIIETGGEDDAGTVS